jgi:hypothetical protein
LSNEARGERVRASCGRMASREALPAGFRTHKRSLALGFFARVDSSERISLVSAFRRNTCDVSVAIDSKELSGAIRGDSRLSG